MAKRTVAEFLEGFVLPLVAGGEMHIGKALSIEELESFEQDLGHASVPLVAVDEARAAVLSEIVVRPPALVLEGDELYLAAALHNLLFLVHPDSDGWAVTNRQRARVLEHAQHFASRPLRKQRRRVLARHALLHNLFDVNRTDIKVSWWTGSRTFLGETPPRRLVSWKTVRRVRSETSVASYDDLLGSPDVAPVVATLLRRSPLTQLTGSHPQAPPLHWEDAVFVLRDAELARAVAYAAVKPGTPDAMVAAPARYAAAFEQMLERKPDEADVRCVAAFLVHLGVLLAVAEERDRKLDAKSPLLTTVLAPERAGQRPRGLATFFSLPNALSKIDPRVAHPPGLLDEPNLARRWRVHRKQVAQGVGDAVIDTLAGRLARHLGARGRSAPRAKSAPPEEPTKAQPT